MDGRPVGLSITVFFFIAILEASAQNFYTLRYGKRDSQAEEDRFPKDVKYERGLSAEDNLFFGSRYGKHSLNASRFDSKAFGGVEVSPDRIGRSPETETTTRNNRFYFGQRFGKRGERGRPEGLSVYQQEEGQDGVGDIIFCRYTGFRHLYHCPPQVSSVDVGDVF